MSPRAPDIPYIPALFPNWGFEERTKSFYLKEVFGDFRDPVVEIMPEPSLADFILVPHLYVYRDRGDFIARALRISKDSGKPLILFAHGDSAEEISLPRTVVFRYSQYRSKKRPYEIIAPIYSEDLGKTQDVTPRRKGSEPTIGFCGWAEYASFSLGLKAALRHAWIDSVAIVHSELRAQKKGIYFRKKALSFLQAASGIHTNFIVRRSHGYHTGTIQVSKESSREEFIDNILASDLALAVKGDGNASIRFYEILSLGRVPLVVDTDMVFPFEDRIDYPSFTFSVPFDRLSEIGGMVNDFWGELSPEYFEVMQRQAREIFLRYLEPKAFLREAFQYDYLMKHVI